MKKFVSIVLSALITVGCAAVTPLSAGAASDYLPSHKSSDGVYNYVVYDNKYAELTFFNGLPKEQESKKVYEIPSEVDGYEVRYLGSFLFSCNYLYADKVVIPDTVTHIGSYAFAGDEEVEQNNMSEAVIPSSVTEIGERAFRCCPKLQSVTLPENIRRIGDYAFEDCWSLAEVNLPDTIDTISEGSFKDCVSLESIKLPDHSVNIKREAFYNCPKLKTLNVTREYNIGAYAFGFQGYKYDEGEIYAQSNKKISGAVLNVAYTDDDGIFESIYPIANFANIYGISATYNVPTAVKKRIPISAGATFKMLFDSETASNFTSSKPSVLRVTKGGNVTALRQGNATISATLKNGNTFKLNVKVPENPMVYKKQKDGFYYGGALTLYRGQTKNLFAYGKANGVDLKFKNTSIAEFTSKKTSRNLKIKGLKTGKTTIKVRINGVWCKIKVKVK